MQTPIHDLFSIWTALMVGERRDRQVSLDEADLLAQMRLRRSLERNQQELSIRLIQPPKTVRSNLPLAFESFEQTDFSLPKTKKTNDSVSFVGHSWTEKSQALGWTPKKVELPANHYWRVTIDTPICKQQAPKLTHFLEQHSPSAVKFRSQVDTPYFQSFLQNSLTAVQHLSVQHQGLMRDYWASPNELPQTNQLKSLHWHNFPLSQIGHLKPLQQLQRLNLLFSLADMVQLADLQTLNDLPMLHELALTLPRSFDSEQFFELLARQKLSGLAVFDFREMTRTIAAKFANLRFFRAFVTDEKMPMNWQFLAKLENLHSLALSGFKRDIAELAQALDQLCCQQIETLRLNFDLKSDPQLRFLDKFTQILNLELGQRPLAWRKPQVKPLDLTRLGRLKQLESLRLLDFRGGQFAALPRLAKLKVLELPSAQLRGPEIRKLSAYPQLQQLDFGFAASTKTSSALTALKALRNLEVLTIRSQKLKPAALQHICQLTTVKTLSIIGKNSFDDRSFQMLQNMTKLEVLAFEDVTIIASAFLLLKSCKKLHTLLFFGDSIIQGKVTVLEKLNSLRYLRLPRHIRSDIRKRLQQKRQDWVIQ